MEGSLGMNQDRRWPLSSGLPSSDAIETALQRGLLKMNGMRQQPRVRLVGEDSDRYRPNVIFELLASEVRGDLLWLHVGSMTGPHRLFTMLPALNLPFLACPS